MNWDFKFHLVPKNSSLRNLENNLPLKIDTLCLGSAEFLVNNTIYGLRIIQLFHNQETPEEIRHDNNYEGVSHDVDRYGFKVNEVVEREPGEIIIDNRSKDVESGPRQEEVHMRHRLKMLEPEHKTLERRQKVEKLAFCGQRALKSLEKDIKEYKDKLILYDLRRENASPQSTNYIQLTISNDAGKRVERINYTKSIYVAMKYLIEKLLRERRETIKIRTLKVGYIYGLLRLPPNLNLKIEELDIYENHINILKAIEPILIASSLPLKSITIHESPSMENYIIQTAQKLVLAGSLFSLGPELRYRRVHVSFYWLPILDIMHLIQVWLAYGSEIGTCYSFVIKDYNVAKNSINLIKQIPGARVEKTNPIESIFFPMDDSSELKIYCTWYPDNKIKDLVMEVQEK